MKKVTLKAANLQNCFRLFRVKVNEENNIQEIKDLIMDKMNTYLEENDGFLLLVLKNYEQFSFLGN